MGFFSDLISQIPRVGASLTRAPTPPAAGIYHFLIEEKGEKTRAHLRVEPDGGGMLLVNANRSFHLNPTATHLAYLYLSKEKDASVVASLTQLYHVSEDQARQDYAQMVSQLQALLRPDGACPICDVELETVAPFSVMPSAPYRMDLAVTYRCNNDCAHCYNARDRHTPELDTKHWKQVLDRLWEAGIPHIVFTGGEPTLRPDLPELVAHAEKNGQITGINTNGRLLVDAAYVQTLADAGLDHIQVTLESHLPEIHNRMVARSAAWDDTVRGIKNALATRLFVMTNTTLLEENSAHLAGTLAFLAKLGVQTVGLNALIYSGRGLTVGTGLSDESLPPLLELARRSTQEHGQRLIWYTPTEYCHFDPVQMELGVKGCSAARYNMCVEPDGTVIPCQSYYQSIGNLLSDPWESIWNNDLAKSLREHRNLPQGCVSCALLSECGGGCPLARQAAHTISALSA